MTPSDTAEPTRSRGNVLFRTERAASVTSVAVVALAAYSVGAMAMSVQDDEPLFADPARSAAQGLGYRTDLLQGLVPGAEVQLMWQPPGYPVLLGLWYRLVGFGLVEGRLLSVTAMATSLAIVYLLTRKYASQRGSLIAVAAVAVVPWCTSAATTIRPEALAILAVVAAAYAIDRYTALGGIRVYWAFVVLATTAVLLHPIGVIAPALVTTMLVRSRRPVLAALTAALIASLVAAVWVPLVARHWQLFLAQMMLQGERKPAFSLFTLLHSEKRLPGYVLLGLAILFLVYAKRWREVPTVVVLGLVVTTVAATVGAEKYYPAYIIVLGAPVIAIAWDALAKFGARGVILVVALAVASSPSAVALSSSVLRAGAVDVIDQNIRPSDRIFIGPGGGGLYFRAAPQRVRAFSPVPTRLGAMDAVLRGQDVIVMEMPVPREPEELFRAVLNRPLANHASNLGVWRLKGD